MIIAVVTLISALLSKDLKRPPANALIVVLFLFVAWTGVSTIFAFDPDASFERWKTLMKTQLFVFLIPMLFHTKEQVRQLIWVIVLSIAYYGTKGGVWILLTGGGNRVWGPAGSYIEDNNALAVAVIMMIPLMRYLQLTTPHKYVRWGLAPMMLFCGVGALGSHSRGALLAVSAMFAVLWWKSRHKLGLTLVAVVAIPLMFAYMPEHWYQRMDTIVNYELDGSANMRLNSWGTMFNIAKDRPLDGGGFEVAAHAVYQRYAPDPSFPPQVAHSIYFQARGEHGFVGFGLYLLLLFTFWRHSGALARLAKGQPGLAWAGDFGLMMQVTIIGFEVGGAFLSLVNFDVPYYLIAAMVAAGTLVAKELQHAQAHAPAPAIKSSPFGGIRADRSPKVHGG
jgi:probable O-glycosylation ligase (exosortase A-associated)